MNVTIHHNALVSADVKLGKNVSIYPFTNLYGCEIGEGTKIGTFVEVQKGARIGKRCKISSHSFICEGVTIGHEVFIGHGVTFTNDRYPRAVNQDGSMQTDEDWETLATKVGNRVSIGSGVTLLGGLTIGEGSIVGAGSVVTKDVPPNCVIFGNPAKVKRHLS